MAKCITPKNADLKAALPIGGLAFSLQERWTAEQIGLLSPRTLAYLGDAVFEMALRLRHVAVEVDSSGRLHDSVVGLVCANHQAKLFDHVLSDLSIEEQALMKTWRNTKLPYRTSGTSRKIYAKSTAFEALIGLLFLQKENDRLIELFDLAEILSREEFKKNSSQGAEGEGSDDQMGEK